MRTSDYIEAAVVALAGLLVLIAIPCAGIVGTTIHDAETQTYLEQARTRHTLVAKAVADSVPAVLPGTVGSTVSARWQVARADMDAVTAAVLGWFIVALVAAQVVVGVRAHVNRTRDIQLEREIRSLINDGGGRTNSSQ
jgi:hypothetical protein